VPRRLASGLSGKVAGRTKRSKRGVTGLAASRPSFRSTGLSGRASLPGSSNRDHTVRRRSAGFSHFLWPSWHGIPCSLTT
jgi:hypothetical protein